ncbi:MAG: SDR family oxidoreductase [Neisseriaceae bacterium]
MGFLKNKKILITGLISQRSIAYGVASACKAQGAELAFTYALDKMGNRVMDIARQFDSNLVFRCDVQKDEEIASVFESLAQVWGGLDGFLHAVAFAPKEALEGDFLTGINRDAFRISQEVSAYSLAALAKAARPLMQGRAASIVALSYLGAIRAVHNYNTMGLAKASLEAAIRYIAQALGPDGVRCNGISAGPIKTLAASGISGFSKALKLAATQSLLKRNVTAQEVGNVAAFLFSDLASGVTGEVTYVDCGYSHSAFAASE